jgi:hypothetical protein
MTSQDHWDEAERLLESAVRNPLQASSEVRTVWLRAARLHVRMAEIELAHWDAFSNGGRPRSTVQDT